jgi:hypothetical protein
MIALRYSPVIRTIIILASLTPVPAQNTTTLNATGVDAKVGWVSAGSGRSTLNIIWSCLAVFIVCSWKCVHLNIPSREESEAGWHKFKGVPYWPEGSLWSKWLRKAKWMGIMAIAPELGVAIAVRQYLEARKGLRGSKWSIAHGFYANMGGYAVRIPSGDSRKSDPTTGHQTLKEESTQKKNPQTSSSDQMGDQTSKEESMQPKDSEYVEYPLTLKNLGQYLLLAYNSVANCKSEP